jgi:hypothetical protein
VHIGFTAPRANSRERAASADLIISLLSEITVRGLKPTTKVIELHAYIRVQNLSCSVLCVRYDLSLPFLKINKFWFLVISITVIKPRPHAPPFSPLMQVLSLFTVNE